MCNYRLFMFLSTQNCTSSQDNKFCRIEDNYLHTNSEASGINCSEKKEFYSTENINHSDKATTRSCNAIRHNDVLTIDQSIFVNLGNEKEDAIQNTATVLAPSKLDKSAQYMTIEESQIETTGIRDQKDVNCSTAESTLEVMTENNTITPTLNDIPSTKITSKVIPLQPTMTQTTTPLLNIPIGSTKKVSQYTAKQCLVFPSSHLNNSYYI